MLTKSAVRFGLVVGTTTFALVWGCTSPAPARDDDGIVTSAGSGAAGTTDTTSGMGGAVSDGGATNAGGMSGAGGMTTTTSSTTTSTTTGGGTCTDMCIDQYPDGLADLTALVQCSTCRYCATVCGAASNSLCTNISPADCTTSGTCNDCLNGCAQTACATEQNQCFGVNQDCSDLNDCIEACP